MMKLRDFTVASYSRTVTKLLNYHSELLLAIHNKRNEASLANELSIQTSLSLIVGWENFINDLLLAYARSNSIRVLRECRNRIKKSLEDKFGKTCARKIKCNFPRTPSEYFITALIDIKGKNITASTADELADFANRNLPGHYAKNFTLEPRDSQFYNYMIALRNYLGHYSVNALKKLRQTIQDMQHPDNRVFNARFTQIGHYLKEPTHNGSSRTQLIGQRIIELAQKL